MNHVSSLLSDQVDAREIAIIVRELDAVVARRVEGDVVEFGCYVGTTSVFLGSRLKETDKQLYLYDSFEGLPPKTAQDDSPAGLQFKTGELLATKKQLLRKPFRDPPEPLAPEAQARIAKHFNNYPSK